MPKIVFKSQGKRTPYSKPSTTSNTVIEKKAPPIVENEKKCLLCQKVIPSRYDEVYDLKLHYTRCYIKAGKMSQFLEELGGSVTDYKVRKFKCPDSCTKRTMIAVEYLIHLGIIHEVTRELMAEDPRKAMQATPNKCFPNPQKTHLTTLKTLQKIRDSNVVPVVSESRWNTLSERLEAEKVDNPSPPLHSTVKSQPKVPSIKIKEESSDYQIESKPSIKLMPDGPSPKVNRIHKCLLCDQKEGRNLHLSEDGLHTLVHHYAACYYNLNKYRHIVSPGIANQDHDGGPLEELSRFKYKCPFQTCENNSGKRPAKPMFFKAYAIHCAAFHGQLEVALARDVATNPGLEEVRLAVLRYRQIKSEVPEVMPSVIVEEFHTCVICKGETGKEAVLSLHKDQRQTLKRHYVNCYYDLNTEMFVARYSPGPDNTDPDTGRPLDELGTKTKYHCREAACLAKKKNQYGYKSFCIHMAVDHGELLEIMREDTRQEVRDILQKLEEN